MQKNARQHSLTGISVSIATIIAALSAKASVLALIAPPPSVKSHES